MELSDSLDFGKRQEMAATVKNEYQYHLDQRKEQQLRDEKERYKHTLVIVSLVALLLAFVWQADTLFSSHVVEARVTKLLKRVAQQLES